MSSKPYKGFSPKWYTEKPPAGSYRSILKWGDPEFNKVPKETLYKMIKDTFHLTDEDFSQYRELGLEQVKFDLPTGLSDEQLARFAAIVGADNVKTDDYSRLSVAYGKTMYDLLRLRKRIVENVPGAVLYPENKEQIQQIVTYCDEQRIPVYVYGGGSSVTRGVEAMKGGVTLDMRRHFNKVLDFNETDQTITVEAGMSGPQLERCSTTPSSAWARTAPIPAGIFRRALSTAVWAAGWSPAAPGQNSTYYGKIEDIVLGQEYATPVGTVKTDAYPARPPAPPSTRS